jgi:hypothetical protein
VWFAINASSSPSCTNRIPFVGDLKAANWRTLGTSTADPSGIFQVEFMLSP